MPWLLVSSFSGMSLTDKRRVSHSMNRSDSAMGAFCSSTLAMYTPSTRPLPTMRVTVWEEGGMEKSSRHWTRLRVSPLRYP